MQLTRFSVVFVVLLGRICFSKILIKTNKPDGYAELEEAAIKTLSNCYGDKDKTMVLAGDIPGTFVKKLSSQRSHSIVSMEKSGRMLNDLKADALYAMHKVHILVAMAPDSYTFAEALNAFAESKYHGTMVSVLIIGWSPIKKYGTCNSKDDIMTALVVAQVFEQTDANLICRDIKKGIVIYGLNAFTNRAPKPWRFVASTNSRLLRHVVSYFIREYREHEEMCGNLFFEKFHDMNGAKIKVNRPCAKRPCRFIIPESPLLLIDQQNNKGFLSEFILYMNATEETTWQMKVVGEYVENEDTTVLAIPINLKGMIGDKTYTYPYYRACKFIVTQFRGNKSQTRKIYDVLDGYSWGGMIVVYLITLIFFKYFLRQPLPVAILNLWRLTCSFGLPEVPPNVPPRIYLSCLLFFMVTMQGIFTSSLASVMTHDVPVRQVNTFQDLSYFGYTVYADRQNLIDLKENGFNGRRMETEPHGDCFQYVERDNLVACVTVNNGDRIYAMHARLYVSTGCVKLDYIAMILPRDWALQEILNKFIGVKTAGGFMTNLRVLVLEKRLLEKELEEKVVEPEIMVLTDLVFAFVILGIGWGCAFVSFIVEVMIPIYREKVRDHSKFRWICRCVR